MKNYLIVLVAWIVFINVVYFAPWVLLIASILFGIKVEIGTMTIGMNGMIPQIKKLKELNKELDKLNL